MQLLDVDAMETAASADAARTARITAAKIIHGEYTRQTRHSRMGTMQDSRAEVTVPPAAAAIQTLYGKIQTYTAPVKIAQLPYRE